MKYNYNNYNNNKCNYKDKNEYNENCYMVINHNHEFESSTDYKENDEGVLHNHRIAGVTGPPMKCGKTHIHKVAEFTDTFIDHFHEICDTTGPAIYLPGGKHIHLLKGKTTAAEDNNHKHDYFFTTLIEDPTNVPEDKKC